MLPRITTLSSAVGAPQTHVLKNCPLMPAEKCEGAACILHDALHRPHCQLKERYICKPGS